MNSDVVQFKSWPRNYEKEKSGLKPNTERTVDWKDQRFKTLAKWSVTLDYGIVRIVNTADGESFERQVQDVTFFGSLAVISWRGPDI